MVLREPTEIEIVKNKLNDLEDKVRQLDTELKQVKVKMIKHTSVGFFRSRFK